MLRGRSRTSARGNDDEPADAGGREGCVEASSTTMAAVWGPGPTAVTGCPCLAAVDVSVSGQTGLGGHGWVPPGALSDGAVSAPDAVSDASDWSRRLSHAVLTLQIGES